MVSSARLSPGCFGKLPLAADYLRHHRGGLSVLEWERWLEDGVFEASRVLGREVEGSLRRMPPARFLFAGRKAPTLLLGTIGPGADRSGRLFPFSIFVERPDDALAAWELPGAHGALLDRMAAMMASPPPALPELFDAVDRLADGAGGGLPANGTTAPPGASPESGTLGALLGPGGYESGTAERIAHRLARLAHRIRLAGEPPDYGLAIALPEGADASRVAHALWLRGLGEALRGARLSLYWRLGGEGARLLAWAGPPGPRAFRHWLDVGGAGEDLYQLDEAPGAAERLPDPMPPATSLEELIAWIRPAR